MSGFEVCAIQTRRCGFCGVQLRDCEARSNHMKRVICETYAIHMSHSRYGVATVTRSPYGVATVSSSAYGVATVSRIDKITGPFCKRTLSKRLYSAKETYNFKEPRHDPCHMN